MSHKTISKRHLRRKIKFNASVTWKHITDYCNAPENNDLNVHHLNSDFRNELHRFENVADGHPSKELNTGNSDTYHTDLFDICVPASATYSNPSMQDQPVISPLNILDEQIDSIEDTELFVNKFRAWALNNNVSHKCLNELISLIHTKYPFLPKDARSLLKTPRLVSTLLLENGSMIYIGIKNQLEKRILSGHFLRGSHILLHCNIDGIPLYRSSATEFWPILARCSNAIDKSPFCIAVFCGKGKPSPLDTYLHRFITELQELVSNGIFIDNILFTVEIELFTCDAPARAYLKSVSGHTSKYACERCKIKSKFSEKKHYFPVGKKFIREKILIFISTKRVINILKINRLFYN